MEGHVGLQTHFCTIVNTFFTMLTKIQGDKSQGNKNTNPSAQAYNNGSPNGHAVG